MTAPSITGSFTTTSVNKEEKWIKSSTVINSVLIAVNVTAGRSGRTMSAKLVFEFSEDDIKQALVAWLNDYQSDVIRYRDLDITLSIGEARAEITARATLKEGK